MNFQPTDMKSYLQLSKIDAYEYIFIYIHNIIFYIYITY